MIEELIETIPKTRWQQAKLGDVAEVNPKLPNKEDIAGKLEVQFLPMKLVEELTGNIHLTETRTYADVKKGYTPFINGDIVFAKVTPCMENGKVAIVDNLKNGIGFGSSEFHVVRCGEKLYNKYAFYFLVQQKFRAEAEAAMTGAVGLRRVPKQFLEKYNIPLPPVDAQRQIVSKIEELFSELDKSIEGLKTAQQQLKLYRQSVLKWAFEGRLTNDDVKEGEFPKGWQWRILSEVSEISGGLTKNSKREHFGLKLPFLRVANVYFNELDLSEMHSIGVKETETERVRLEKNDLLFVEGNGSIDQIGRVALWNGEIENCVHQNHLIKSRLSSEVIPKYTLYFFLSTAGRERIKQQANSTSGLHTLSLGKISKLELPVCSFDEQKQIVQEIEDRLSVADKLEEAITDGLQQAETVRQSILKKTFQGDLY